MDTINIVLCASNLFCAGLVAALAIPLTLGRVRMNPTYGVRFRRSFESDELWLKINRYGGRLMLSWSIVVATAGVASLFVPLAERHGLAILLACVPLVYVVPAWQSYRYSLRA